MVAIQPRPTRRTRAKRAAEKPTVEARLLAATERLLDKGHKFAALTVEELTAEAGMARGTFYLHFKDKGELVARLMGQLANEVVQGTGVWFDDPEHSGKRDVQAALAGIVDTFKRHQAIVSAINDTAPFDDNVQQLYHGMIESICQRSRRSFATVRRQRRAKSGASDDVSDILVWSVVLYCARFVGTREGPDLTRLSKSFGYICSSSIFSET